MLLMLELVSRRGQRLSEILAPFRERYFLTGEINTTVDDVALKLQELKERFGSEGGVSHLGRPLGDRRGLAYERAAVKHGTASATQPRGSFAGADGAQA